MDIMQKLFNQNITYLWVENVNEILRKTHSYILIVFKKTDENYLIKFTTHLPFENS